MCDVMNMPAQTQKQRVAKALAIAGQYGQIEGAHHKAWVIDQMVRALTGCPAGAKVVKHRDSDAEYTYWRQMSSLGYHRFVKAHKEGEDGPETYSWDEGIAP